MAYVLLKSEAAPLPLQIEQSVGQRHRPDLVAVDETGQVRLWVDCGQIEPKRLARIATQNTQACVLVIKATASEAEAYARAARKPLEDVPKDRADVQFLGFDTGFLERFVAERRGNNTLKIMHRVSQSDIGPEMGVSVTINDVGLGTEIIRFGQEGISKL